MTKLLLLFSVLFYQSIAFGQDWSAAIKQTTGLVEGAKVIVVGEIHGTQEMPEFFRDLVVEVSKAHQVCVGLELSSNAGSAMDTYLQSSGSAQDIDKFFRDASNWLRGYQDGRNSSAMLKLIDALREKEDICVYSFDVRGTDDREQAMTDFILDKIAAEADAEANRVHLLLAGNVHGRLSVGVPWDKKFESMAYRLNRKHQVASVELVPSGGSAWMCQDPICKQFELGGRQGEKAVEVISEHPVMLNVLIGTVTASFPAAKIHGF
tara:strand:- start:7264 stop:8058 length:795 start_codon:yes stop_codon:yes gene_type:complete